MRALPLALLSATLAAACAPTATAPAQDPTPPAPDGVPARAAGKMSAAQVGTLTPVPAFQGGGAGWRVEIQSLGDMRHSVRLTSNLLTSSPPTSGQPARVDNGTVVYQPPPSSLPTPATILLTGTLYGPGGDRALRITLNAHTCRDAAGAEHRHAVQVEVAGAPDLHGCGDLAVY